MKPVTIACAADRMYVRPLAAMLRSVLDNLAPDRGAAIYVLESGIDEASREAVTLGWDRDRFSIHWITAHESSFAGLPLWGRMPVSTYFRIALGELLPPEVERAIWLDCDLLVLADISELWERDLEGNDVAAVQDVIVPVVSSKCGIEHYAKLGISPSAKYFNAGVMVIDVSAWRRHGLRTRIVDYLTKYQDSVVFWDQEGLNAVLAGRWRELEARWNGNASVPASRRPEGEMSVAHFTGSIKPWRYRTSNPLRNLYYEYLDRTAFSGWRPRASLAGAMVHLYEESGLRRLVYPAESLGMRVIRKLSRR